MIDNIKKTIISDELINIIYKHSEKIVLKKSDTIITPYTKIESTYFVDKGRFIYALTETDGNKLLSKFEERGALIALAAMYSETVVTNITITADTDSIVYKINKSTLDYLLKTSTIFRVYILNDLCKNILKITYHSELLALKTNKEKVYCFLKNNADFENPIDGNWYNLKYKFKQQEIADYLGITRITVWKVMNELAEEGLVRTINKKIQIRLKLNDKNK